MSILRIIAMVLLTSPLIMSMNIQSNKQKSLAIDNNSSASDYLIEYKAKILSTKTISSETYIIEINTLNASNELATNSEQIIPIDKVFEFNDPDLPQVFSLGPNYPNPFNASTSIKYAIPIESNVKIDIFDILGRHIETLINKDQLPGYYRLLWSPRSISSGIYFYRIKTDEFNKTNKMLLIK